MSARTKRQQVVGRWAINAFGEAEAKGITQRSLRLLEEAAEAAQAGGVNIEKAIELLLYVWNRPPGELSQEIGGVGVTLLALAQAMEVDADDCERDEVGRILSKPIEYFRERNKAKNDAGFKA